MSALTKQKQNSGFTLAELLIVIAIIGVLVAVSIPIFSNQLEKSREATDMANLRSAKAAAIVAVISGEIEDGTPIKDQTNYWYNIQTGKYQTAELASGYGKGITRGNYYYSTKTGGANSNNPYGYNSGTDYSNACIEMSYEETNGVKRIRIYFKQHDIAYNHAGKPDDWQNATIINA
jgi:type IV pilus assembly protein PilA